MESLRLDVWLDVACLFRTRSDAQKACNGGKIEVNGVASKPHRQIRPGDALSIGRPMGRRQRVVVKTLAERHIPKAEARTLYEDVTPPPTPAEVEAREVARLMRPFMKTGPTPSPTTRQRRALRRLKEQG